LAFALASSPEMIHWILWFVDVKSSRSRLRERHPVLAAQRPARTRGKPQGPAGQVCSTRLFDVRLRGSRPARPTLTKQTVNRSPLDDTDATPPNHHARTDLREINTAFVVVVAFIRHVFKLGKSPPKRRARTILFVWAIGPCAGATRRLRPTNCQRDATDVGTLGAAEHRRRQAL